MAKNKPNQGARKTETLTLRLDPKVKMMIELTSRIRRQSITGVIESAIEEIASDLNHSFFYEGKTYEFSVSELVAEVWSTDESQRFINLCYHSPTLLTYEEQRIWETLKASSYFIRSERETLCTDWEIPGVGYLAAYEIRNYWERILEHVEANKDSRTVVPFDPKA